jgi:hypothetical protein
MFHAHGDIETDPQAKPRSRLSVKRQRIQSPNNSPASSRASSPMPPLRKNRDAGRHRGDNDDASPTASRGGSQRSHDRSAGKRKAPQSQTTQTSLERAALTEVQELKAELARARADAAAAIALAAEREPAGLGGSVDRLRSRAYIFSNIFIHSSFFFVFCGWEITPAFCL